LERHDERGDALQDVLPILHDLVIAEAMHAVALRLEPGRARRIAPSLRRVVVYRAIELNDEFKRRTTGIENERTNRMLAPKATAGAMPTQTRPECPLRSGHVPPQRLGRLLDFLMNTADARRWGVRHGRPPW
jgi:hypothetical protein